MFCVRLNLRLKISLPKAIKGRVAPAKNPYRLMAGLSPEILEARW
jgi:hypothetical protein